MSPPVLLLIAGFLLPLAFVAYTSLMPPRTFGLDGQHHPRELRHRRARGLLAADDLVAACFALATTVLTMLISWPIAKALVRRSRRFATIVATLIAVPVFIAESVRLFGAHLFLMPRGGILAGTINYCFGIEIGSVLFTPLATLIGLALHPSALRAVSDGAGPRASAARPGRGRARPGRQPLAGTALCRSADRLARHHHRRLLVFVLVLGATPKSHMLGGQSVTCRSALPSSSASTTRRTGPWARPWRRSCVAITALLVFPLLSRLDLDRLFGR